MKGINQLAVALGASLAELTGETSQIVIPSALRGFGIQNSLSCVIIDKLARIPMRGKEPKSVHEWQMLVQAISPFIDEKKNEEGNVWFRRLRSLNSEQRILIA